MKKIDKFQYDNKKSFVPHTFFDLFTKSFLNSYKKNAITFLRFCQPVLQESLLCYVTWLGPFILLTLCYISNFVIFFIKQFSEESNAESTRKSLSIVSTMWSLFTTFWHSQTFTGLVNIPKSGSGLLVWYHGPMPVDYFGMVAEVYKRDGRVINSVVDRCLHCMPGLGTFRKILKCGALSKVNCAGLLEDGELVGLAPGGAREALFDDNYSVCWRQRAGFAKVAALTKSPIIPIFTENIRLAYCPMASGGQVWRTVYEFTKLPFVPIYGGFPVQLNTHIGRPIMPIEGETVMQLQERVKMAMKDLVSENQTQDMDIKTAVGERIIRVMGKL